MVTFRSVLYTSEDAHWGIGIHVVVERHSVEIFHCYPTKYGSEGEEKNCFLTLQKL